MTSKGFCTRGLLLFLIYTGLFNSTISYSVSDAKNLHDHLFNTSRYNKLFRPKSTVIIEARYNLQYLNSIDIKSHIMSTTGLFSLFWNDSRLTWEKSSFGDIPYTYVTEDLVWHPTLVVLNAIRELEKSFGAESTIRISSDGHVRWEPIAVLSTSCAINVVFFPLDSQKCSIELASLDIPSNAVKLTFLTDPINLGLLDTLGDWEDGPTANKSCTITEGFVEYSCLKFEMVFKRLAGHYILIVIFPTILTAVLTFVTFFLPLKSGVRIGYIITVVLALVILLTLFADTMPSAAKYPSILVISFTIALGMAFLLIIITVFVMRLYRKPKHYTAPKWMHFMVRMFRKLKLKCKCRAKRINPLKQNQPNEDGKLTEGIDSMEKSTSFKQYSNKELVVFFDCFLFVIFIVLYMLALSCLSITAIVWHHYPFLFEKE